MTMGIVNAGAMPIYSDIELPMRDYIEEVVLNHSEDGAHVARLLKFAEEEKEKKTTGGGAADVLNPTMIHLQTAEAQRARVLGRVEALLEVCHQRRAITGRA